VDPPRTAQGCAPPTCLAPPRTIPYRTRDRHPHRHHILLTSYSCSPHTFTAPWDWPHTHLPHTLHSHSLSFTLLVTGQALHNLPRHHPTSVSLAARRSFPCPTPQGPRIDADARRPATCPMFNHCPPDSIRQTPRHSRPSANWFLNIFLLDGTEPSFWKAFPRVVQPTFKQHRQTLPMALQPSQTHTLHCTHACYLCHLVRVTHTLPFLDGQADLPLSSPGRTAGVPGPKPRPRRTVGPNLPHTHVACPQDAVCLTTHTLVPHKPRTAWTADTTNTTVRLGLFTTHTRFARHLPFPKRLHTTSRLPPHSPCSRPLLPIYTHAGRMTPHYGGPGRYASQVAVVTMPTATYPTRHTHSSCPTPALPLCPTGHYTDTYLPQVPTNCRLLHSQWFYYPHTGHTPPPPPASPSLPYPTSHTHTHTDPHHT